MLSDLNWAFFSGFTYSALRVFIYFSGELCLGFTFSRSRNVLSGVIQSTSCCTLPSDLRPTCIVDSPKIIKTNSQNQSFYFVLLSHNLRDMKQEPETLILH